METITLILDENRTGAVSGYLGGLTTEIYRIEGREVATGSRLALLAPEGRTLAATGIEVDDQGLFAEVSTDTQEVADFLRYQPLGAEAQVFVMVGDADNILGIIPAKIRKNWLDDSAVHPPAPLPDYWTSGQTRDAIAEALKGYATQAWVSGQLEDYLPLTGGTVKGSLSVVGGYLSVDHGPRSYTGNDVLRAADLQGALVPGDNVTLERQVDGRIRVSATSCSYTLPIASSCRLGGIMVGAGLGVDEYGAMNLCAACGLYINDSGVLALCVGAGLCVDGCGVLVATGGDCGGGDCGGGTGVYFDGIPGQMLIGENPSGSTTYDEHYVSFGFSQDGTLLLCGTDGCSDRFSAQLATKDYVDAAIASGGGDLPSSILVSSGDPATVDAEAKKYAVIGAGASGDQCSVVVGDGGFANEGGVALGKDARAEINGVAIGHTANVSDLGLAAGDTASAGRYAVALGVSACAEGTCSVALGAYATTYLGEGVAVGPSAAVTGSGGVAIGTYAKAFKHSVALGYRAQGGSGWYEGKAIAIGHYSEAKDDNLAIGVGAVACSPSYGNLALGSCAFVGYDADFENAAIGYGAVVDGVCTYRAAVLGAQGYTNISGGTVLSASDREQTLTLQLYLVACRELCKYGVIGLTMTDWLTGETFGVYTGADVFMAALNGTPWTGAFGGFCGCCSCAA